MATLLRHWTAAVATRGEERRAAHHVERLGFRYYLPEILVLGSTGDYTCRRLLFPGYIFIKLREGWEHLLHVRGVIGFFLQDERPVPVPTREIDFLRSLEDEDGFVYLGQRVRAGLHVRVRREAGSLAGLRGYVTDVRRGRCAVLLKFMGHDVRKMFHERQLDVAV